MIKSTRTLVVSLLIALWPMGSIWSATPVTTSFTVSVQITAICTVNLPANIVFPEVTGAATAGIAQQELSTDIQVTCTEGTPYAVGLVSDLKLKNGPNQLNFEMYKSDRSSLWNDSLRVSATGTGSPITHKAWARLLSQPIPAPGFYSTTVSVNVIY